MPTTTPGTTDPVPRRLRALADESPELGEAARIYKALLPLLRDADLHAGAVSLATGQALEKLKNGIPLLHGIDLELDAGAARELMTRLARTLEGTGIWSRMPWPFSSRKTSARRVRKALESGSLDLGVILQHITAGANELAAAEARRLGLDPLLVRTLAQNTLKPALREWRRQLSPLATGAAWDRGTCFLCGARATLAELRENSQEKHLRCGACGADWRVRRLRCVWCGNEDPAALRYLYADGRRERMHVESCDTCGGYIKIIAAFSATPPEALVIEDLATLHLDAIAQKQGYTRERS